MTLDDTPSLSYSLRMKLLSSIIQLDTTTVHVNAQSDGLTLVRVFIKSNGLQTFTGSFSQTQFNDQLRSEYFASHILPLAKAAFGLDRKYRVAASNSDVSELMDLIEKHQYLA